MDNLLTEIYFNNDYFLPYLKQFRKYLPIHAKVLEIGSKQGYNVNKLHDLDIFVVGLEEDESLLNIARKKYPNIEFYNYDYLDNATCFDGVFMINSKYDIMEYTDKIYKSLNDDGYFLLINKKDKDEINPAYFLEKASKKKFIVVEELASDNIWDFVIYKKNTIK